MANAPTFRSDNIFLRPAADPTGNNQPAAELMVKQSDGSLASSRLFIVEHAGQKLKGFRANSADSTVFETDETTGQLKIESA
jgi:hypothetical protein